MYKNSFEDVSNNLKRLQVSKKAPHNFHAIQPNAARESYNKPEPLFDNYAINAPAPGAIGVASAMVNRAYDNNQNSSERYQLQQHYSNFNIPNSNLEDPYLISNYMKTASTSSVMKHQIPEQYKDSGMYANLYPYPNTSANYSTYGYDEEFPTPPVPFSDVGCPPSPVSSSYSELRHTQYHPKNAPYSCVPISYGIPSHDETYEPLNQSQELRHTSRYHSRYSSPLATEIATSDASKERLLSCDKIGKEAEVDALTNLLVQSMDSSNDPEFFGICARCSDRVVGEGSGCSAMDQIFHIECFTCIDCLLKLQGKPFYALNSKPYCEDCYRSTLEKCCVCTKPILDRILRATGKPYHPQCFTCVVCSKSLDGIPFTIDAANQIHCIDDFHRKFAPRCSVCSLPIMPESGKEETIRVVALDRSFHVSCYKCEDCGLILSSETEGKGCYPLDNHVLCKGCNARRVRRLTS